MWRVCRVSTFLPVVPCLVCSLDICLLIDLVQNNGNPWSEARGYRIRAWVKVRRDTGCADSPTARHKSQDSWERVWEVEKQEASVHAYLKSVLRLCLLFLEGFRGNELGMMGVAVQGRLLRAMRMQGGRGVVKKEVREKKRNRKNDMTWHAGRTIDPGRDWLFMHMQRSDTTRRNKPLTTWIIGWTNGCKARQSTRKQTTLVFENPFILFHTELLDPIFQCLTVLPFLPWTIATSLKWSPLTHTPVRIGRTGSVHGAGLCYHEWQRGCQSQSCQLGWQQRRDSWCGTRSVRHCHKCVVCLCVSVFLQWCVMLFKCRLAAAQGWWW